MASDQEQDDPGLLSKAALPVFSTFFLWGFGTGALWMIRPLFAFSLGGSIFLVGLVSAASAAPRMLGGPLAGSWADRFGRLPVVIGGAALNGIAVALQAFTDSFAMFLTLELISGFGTAVWVTGSAALLADFTRLTNRGRGVALRNTSGRLGILTGPMVGGIVAEAFSLRAVFLFIAATKVILIIISWLAIRETRERSHQPIMSQGPRKRARLIPDTSLFFTRDFLAISVVTLALGLVTAGPGAFRTFFPVQASASGLTVSDIGTAISITGLVAMFVSLPIGSVVDSRGRKPVLIGGLIVMATSLVAVLGMHGLLIALAVAALFGIGEVMGSNTAQTYAMDLAPVDRRGYFLGTWQATLNVGQVIGPLIVGALATPLGIPGAFTIIAGMLLAAAAFLRFAGRETYRPGNMSSPESK